MVLSWLSCEDGNSQVIEWEVPRIKSKVGSKKIDPRMSQRLLMAPTKDH